jgi:hypothetical protein
LSENLDVIDLLNQYSLGLLAALGVGTVMLAEYGSTSLRSISCSSALMLEIAAYDF